VKTLRKKYDDLVAFTVNLTAEKDLIQRSLDSAREDLQREANSRSQLETQCEPLAPRRQRCCALLHALRRCAFTALGFHFPCHAPAVGTVALALAVMLAQLTCAHLLHRL
jgi:hypothetical protein